MTKMMQSASALTLAAALAAAPVFVMAQQATVETETKVEQATEEVVQETKEAVTEAGQAIENAGQEVAQEAKEVEQEVKQEAAEVETTTTEGAVVVEGAQPLTEGEAVVAAEEPVQPVEGAIRLQDENSMLVSDLMDASVYNAEGEKVGDIDDAIISLDGTVEGVVIGVGGFLGLGEKHVAVEISQISVHLDEDSEPQLIIDATKDSLEEAPEFVTAEDQRDEADRAAMQTAPAGGVPTAGMAPATDAEPEGMATSDKTIVEVEREGDEIEVERADGTETEIKVDEAPKN